MATHRAIAAIGQTLVGLLAEKCPAPEFTGAEFKLCQSSDFRLSKRPQFGISLCLCRVGVNAGFRIPIPPTAPDGRRQPPPLVLDLYYVMNAWAKRPERQQDILGWAMCVLDENPILPASLFNRFAGDAREVFGPQESVKIVPASLDFEQMNAVCELVQIRQQPSIVYTAQPVSIQVVSSPAEAVTVTGGPLPRGKSLKSTTDGSSRSASPWRHSTEEQPQPGRWT
jgi:hypothetical protein